MKPTSTVQQHVRDHLDDFVAIKTRMKAGKVVVASVRYGGERPLERDYSLFYVHPRTGLLRKNEHRISRTKLARELREAKQAALDARMRVVDAKTQLHLFEDSWWEVKLAKIPAGAYVDVVERAELSELPPHRLYDRHGVYAREKRQLSKAEMKRLKLR